MKYVFEIRRVFRLVSNLGEMNPESDNDKSRLSLRHEEFYLLSLFLVFIPSFFHLFISFVAGTSSQLSVSKHFLLLSFLQLQPTSSLLRSFTVQEPLRLFKIRVRQSGLVQDSSHITKLCTTLPNIFRTI